MSWWSKQQLKFGSAEKRLEMVEKLATSEDPADVGTLIEALAVNEPLIRCAAAKALRRFQDRRAVGPLVEILEDSVALVRAAAAETLGHLSDPKALDGLEKLLIDPEPVVRSIAARSLHRLGWRPATDAQRVRQILALGSLEQLADLGPEGVAPLLETLRTGPPNRQLMAVRTLGRFRNEPRVQPAMLEALRKKTPIVRVAALGVLEQFAEPKVLGEVERMFKDTSSAVRVAAVEAALKCGGAKAVPALIQCLQDTSWDVRLGAANALGTLRDPEAIEGLCALIQDPDRDVREGAIKALGKINNKGAIPVLVVGLIDPESGVRTAAAAVLDKIDYRWHEEEPALRAVPNIQHAYRHSTDYWVRHCAGKLLEKLKVKPEVPPEEPVIAPVVEETQAHPAYPVLADLLFDRDRDLRLGAVQALGKLGERRARDLLTESARDPDMYVRQAAEIALAALN